MSFSLLQSGGSLFRRTFFQRHFRARSFRLYRQEFFFFFSFPGLCSMACRSTTLALVAFFFCEPPASDDGLPYCRFFFAARERGLLFAHAVPFPHTPQEPFVDPHPPPPDRNEVFFPPSPIRLPRVLRERGSFPSFHHCNRCYDRTQFFFVQRQPLKFSI